MTVFQNPPLRATAVLVVIGIFAAVHPACGNELACGVTVSRLRCEASVNPLGIDVIKPRLSWELKAVDPTDRGQIQTAYQVLVASTPDQLAKEVGDLWDSGKIMSPTSIQVEYAGKALTSRMTCHWKVRVWDRDGRPSIGSETATWEMALLNPSDWQARWINDGKTTPKDDADFFRDDPAPLFRKEFSVDKPVRRARLYFTGLGYGYASLNGGDVGDHVLDPGVTTYSKRVLYSTFDVTSQIVQGRNCLGLQLGNGWYNLLPLKMWNRFNLRDCLTVGRPRAIAQLEIDFADGSRQVVASDETWKTTPGPVVRNSIYLGEIYDARRELSNWDRPGFDEASWGNAKPANESVGPLQAQSQPPIRITAKLKPARITEPKPGVFLVDMGQNFAGWIRLRVRGEAGATVKLRFGELTYPDGTLNVMTSVAGQIKTGKENRDNAYPQLAYQGDTYILSGRGDEVYTPRFTWHAFRYVEISGFPGKPGLDSLEGLRLSADVSQAGTFGCSHAPFNQIQEMVRWTFLSNLFSVQSDCPHRERFGYGGDIVPTCDAFLLNFDMATFYAKVVRDFADAARPNGGTTEIAPYNGIADAGFGDGTGPLGWQMAYPILLGKLYQYYGDRRLIEEHYPTVQKQLELVRSHAKDYIVTQCLGDHETIEERSVPLTTTAFFYHQAILASQFASLLNRRSEAQQYRELADNIRNAFVAKFFHADTGKLDIGVQACQAFGLHYDLVPPERRSDVLKVLVGEVERHQGHLTTGIFGTRYLLETLSRNGQADVAYHIVNQEGFPGWRHMLERGATTLWEHWEFSDNTYSHNHPMFGSVSDWFFEDLGGIRPAGDANGFDRIVVGPNIVRGLTSAEATYDSIRGPVASRWRVADGKLQMMVTVPPNAQATVRLPTSNPGKVLETGKPLSEAPGVQVQATESKAAVFHISSGEYRFEAEID